VGQADAIITSPPWQDSIGNAAGCPDVKTVRPHLPPAAEVAAYLKACRLARGLTRREVDRHLGTNTLYSWYEGRPAGFEIPTPEHWRELKPLLGLDDRFDHGILTEVVVDATGRLTTDKTGHAVMGDYGTAPGQVGALKPGPCPGGEADVGDVETLTWAGCYKDSWKAMGLLVPAAYAHPAKVAPGLAVRLFDHGFARGWWRKGDLVADPFMGICGFGVIAAYKGLRFVGVEIEERFHSLCLENVALHRRRWEAGGDPPPICLLGDSREFAELVGGVTKLLALWEVHRAGGGADRLGDFGAWVRSVLADVDAGVGAALVAGAAACVTSPPYAGIDVADVRHLHFDDGRRAKSVAVKQDERFPEGYGTAPGQVGALPAGDADSVITSPPYADTGSHGNMTTGAVDCNSWADGRPRRMGPSMNADGYGTAPGQLGGLPCGDAEAVLTSPPYADTATIASGVQRNEAGWGAGKDLSAGKPKGYGTAPGNVGNLAAGDADSVVTSPPYEASLDRRDGDHHVESNRARFAEHGSKPPADSGLQRYGAAPGQVGALRQETYWDAVRCIYGQCLLALRPGGVACVVVKDFVRAKKRVPLCDQTWRLLLSLGFTPVERIRCLLSEETREPSLFGGVEVRKRERKSFFRRLAERKGSPVVDAEEILVVRRPPRRRAVNDSPGVVPGPRGAAPVRPAP
jgi:hypothetical protein